jgi:hypothetical protein
MRAFLSHSSVDKPFVEAVARELGRQFCAFDQNEFETGDDFRNAIRRALDTSDLFVLFASKTSRERKWIEFELDEAELRKIRDYLEEKARRLYVGRSRGVSVRVMKGVYYHTAGFKGYPVDRTERLHVDTGSVAITTKHIYFSGPRRAFRVPFAKIVSFEPFSNGLGFIRDSASAKPQILVTHDGWFTYNLVTNLARL